MALAISNLQQLGGWPFETGKVAVSCTLSVTDDGDSIPIAQLGFRRLFSMWVQSSSVDGVTVRLLGRAVYSPYDAGSGNDYCFTAVGDQTAPTLAITADGTPYSGVGEIDVIFVGEV